MFTCSCFHLLVFGSHACVTAETAETALRGNNRRHANYAPHYDRQRPGRMYFRPFLFLRDDCLLVHLERCVGGGLNCKSRKFSECFRAHVGQQARHRSPLGQPSQTRTHSATSSSVPNVDSSIRSRPLNAASAYQRPCKYRRASRPASLKRQPRRHQQMPKCHRIARRDTDLYRLKINDFIWR